MGTIPFSGVSVAALIRREGLRPLGEDSLFHLHQCCKIRGSCISNGDPIQGFSVHFSLSVTISLAFSPNAPVGSFLKNQ